MNRDKIKMILLAASIFFAVVAILMLVFGIVLDMNTLPRVIIIIISLLSFALAAELGYFLYLLADTKPNYFLYSSQAKRNISVQKLTFDTVNSRMNRYLSGFASSEGKVWNDRVLDNPYIEMGAEFKPLVAYKLLYGLAEKDSEAGWRCLENASDETILFICNGLAENGDKEFASNIHQMMSDKPVNIKPVRDYLVRNRKYIQSKMFKYVYANIEKF